MSVVRAALTLSLGMIVSVGMIILFLQHKDRFSVIPQNRGVYVFDQKNSSLSFCSEKGCALISINADRSPFTPQGLMETAPQAPLGFINPNAAMQQPPFMNPQFSPNNQQPYAQQQNPASAELGGQRMNRFQNQPNQEEQQQFLQEQRLQRNAALMQAQRRQQALRQQALRQQEQRQQEQPERRQEETDSNPKSDESEAQQ